MILKKYTFLRGVFFSRGRKKNYNLHLFFRFKTKSMGGD